MPRHRPLPLRPQADGAARRRPPRAGGGQALRGAARDAAQRVRCAVRRRAAGAVGRVGGWPARGLPARCGRLHVALLPRPGRRRQAARLRRRRGSHGRGCPGVAGRRARGAVVQRVPPLQLLLPAGHRAAARRRRPPRPPRAGGRRRGGRRRSGRGGGGGAAQAGAPRRRLPARPARRPARPGGRRLCRGRACGLGAAAGRPFERGLLPRQPAARPLPHPALPRRRGGGRGGGDLARVGGPGRGGRLRAGAGAARRGRPGRPAGGAHAGDR
mmetsp:Transcript_21494/g.83367  ORF Transcript_21494/g.83367 Transcript_21494/m.83367 type:complete len:271 (-) Transcript_21494:3555-4367(-)